MGCAAHVLILAIVYHLLKRNAKEIGEFLRNLNDVSSDFWSGKILRGLERRIPLPYNLFVSIDTPFGQHLLSDLPKSGQVQRGEW
jgi:hypothetical protein